MVSAPHPESVLRTASGREVQLKVHRCAWSGAYPENSLPAIEECYRARVVRAEVDLARLSDADFLVVHDLDLRLATTGQGPVDQMRRADVERLRFVQDGAATGHRPGLLSEVVATIAAEPFPTRLELDLKDWLPWPWPRVEELARLLEPVKDRITFGGSADWNLRRLLRVDSSMPMGFTISAELDWVSDDEPAPGARGAYGYLDRHPLARRRLGPTADYLRDRLGAILGLVPGARDVHVRLAAVERMLDDGLADLADLLHARGMLLDVWTLNANTPGWRERLARAVAIGADVITTDTPRELAAAWRSLGWEHSAA